MLAIDGESEPCRSADGIPPPPSPSGVDGLNTGACLACLQTIRWGTLCGTCCGCSECWPRGRTDLAVRPPRPPAAQLTAPCALCACSPHVQLASYTQEHPGSTEIVVQCQTTGAISAEQGVVEALVIAKDVLGHMEDSMTAAVAQHSEQEQAMSEGEG